MTALAIMNLGSAPAWGTGAAADAYQHNNLMLLGIRSLLMGLLIWQTT